MIYTLTLNPALDRELTVYEINLDQVLRARSIRIDYGGKGFNVSRALLALGVQSTAMGFIGGSIGEQLQSGLTSLGIHTDFIHISGETRTNLSVVAENHAHYLKVNEPGPSITDSEADALLSKVNRLAAPGDWWIFAGSSPPGIKPPYIAKMIRQVQAAGGYAILDMEGEALRLGCLAEAHLIKPNAFEAGQLIDRQISTIEVAVKAIAPLKIMGARNVAISIGKIGAVYSDGTRIWWAQPPKIEEHNPIGAGDAMLAGLVYGMLNHFPADDILRWGVACGAAAASLDGTAVGSYSLVESLVPNVGIHQAQSST